MTTRPPSTFRTWFDLARAGNFPSVASNVLAAFVLSDVTGDPLQRGGILAVAIIAGLLAYAGGATLNDVMDATHDATHRPERPIPGRRIAQRTALLLGVIELAAGLALSVTAGAGVMPALGLAAVILVYDAFHKNWAGSVLLMAGCRTLLAVVVATLPGHTMTTSWIGWAVALYLYIVILSLLARREDSGGEAVRRVVGRMLAAIPLIDAAALLIVGHWGVALVCAAAVMLGNFTRRIAAST